MCFGRESELEFHMNRMRERNDQLQRENHHLQREVEHRRMIPAISFDDDSVRRIKALEKQNAELIKIIGNLSNKVPVMSGSNVELLGVVNG